MNVYLTIHVKGKHIILGNKNCIFVSISNALKLTFHFFLLAFLCFSGYSQTNKNSLRITGKVKEGKDKLDNVRISLISNGEEVKSILTGNSGRFVFDLPLERDYFLIFSKNGYRSKHVDIFAQGIPEQDAAFGFEFGGLDVALFKQTRGLKDEILNRPVAQIIYDTNMYKFVFNANYFEEIQEEIDSLETELLVLNEDPEKQIELQKQAELDLEKEKAVLEEQKRLAAENEKMQKEALALLTIKEAEKKENNEPLVIKEILKEEPGNKNAKGNVELSMNEPETKIEKVEVNKEESLKNTPALKEPEKTIPKPVVEKEIVKEVSEVKKNPETIPKPLAKKETNVSKDEKIVKNKVVATGKQDLEIKPEKEQKQVKADGVEKEILRQGNKTVTKLLVTKNGNTNEYRRVIADWGGRYFFKDNQPITEATWDAEASGYIN